MTKKPTIYILGATGFLGDYCSKYLTGRGFKVLTKRIDISDSAALKKAFTKEKPGVVINFAGVKAYPNIDWCEDNKEETFKINVAGAIHVMQAALDVGAYPIQISSGCVYSGGPNDLFTEEDEANFYGSFYSRMRIALQSALGELPLLYLRIRMPMSMFPHHRNTITKIASYKEVISIPNSVTLLEDMAVALEKIIAI